MKSNRILSGALAAISAGALTVAMAGVASASTDIDPAGEHVTATSNFLQIIDPATTDTLNCTGVSGDGTIPSSPDNPNTGTGGVDINIDNVDLGTCYLNGVPLDSAATSSGWQLHASADSGSPEGSLLIPDNGAVLEAQSCVITVNQSTVGPMPYDNSSSSVTASNDGTISYESNGQGAFCPAATNGTPRQANLNGTLTFATDTGGPVTVNP